MTSGTKKYARPTFPNSGVEAWYRDQLQELVRAMAQDMGDRVRRAYRDAPTIATAKIESQIEVEKPNTTVKEPNSATNT